MSYAGGRNVSASGERRLKLMPPSYGRLKHGPEGGDGSSVKSEEPMSERVWGT